MARLGQVFDNHWGWRRDWSELDGVRGFAQRGEKDVGHSGIFKPEEWHRFETNGAFALLTEPVIEAPPSVVAPLRSRSLRQWIL
jgi:hypothetical protein